MIFASTLVTLVALVPSALGAIFITQPVATTTWTAGQQVSLTWEDDGTSPSLSQFGVASFGIYAGNSIDQTLLQQIATADVSTTAEIQFVPSANIGPDSNAYFIKVISQNLKDSTNSQFPAEAFSSKFTLTNMSGSFNASVQAEVSGTDTAPIGGSATPTANVQAGATSTLATTSAPTSTSGSAASHSTTASATGGAANGAASMAVSSFATVALALLTSMIVL